MAGEVVDIPIGKLKIDEMNIRDDVNPDDELISSIKNQGIIEPLVVRPDGDGYGIVCGSRRYTASLQTELENLPCVVKDLDDTQAEALSISENKHRKNISVSRWNEVINDFAERINGNLGTEKKVQKISDMTGMGRTTIREYLNIGELPTDIQARLKKPSERSESETKQLESMTPATDSEVPKNVMREVARDEDFKKWDGERQHQVLSKAAENSYATEEVLKAAKRHPEEDLEVAYKKVTRTPQPEKLQLKLDPVIADALDEYMAATGMSSRFSVIRDVLKDFLKREGYLD